MKRFTIVFIVIMMSAFPFFSAYFSEKAVFGPLVASAQDDWKNELDDICSKTQDAMAFTADQLRDIVARCDKLKPTIEKMEDTQRRVYLKRLRMCRDLFVYVLETKESK